MSINGGGTGITGIRILAAATVFIEHCVIFGFRGTAGATAGRGVSDDRTAGGTLYVVDSTFRNNGQTGIVILPASGGTRITATIDNVRIYANGVAGLAASNGSLVTVSNSLMAGHPFYGLYAREGAGNTEVNVENCVLVHNATGLLLEVGSPTVRISNSTIVNNGTGIVAGTGTVSSYGNNRVAGNGAGNAPSAGVGLGLV